jgi:nucleoid DNA-binding protein
MKPYTFKAICKEIATKYKVTPMEAEAICSSQFYFVRKVMASGSDSTVRLQYLGKFLVREGKRERVATLISNMIQRKRDATKEQ